MIESILTVLQNDSTCPITASVIFFGPMTFDRSCHNQGQMTSIISPRIRYRNSGLYLFHTVSNDFADLDLPPGALLLRVTLTLLVTNVNAPTPWLHSCRT